MSVFGSENEFLDDLRGETKGSRAGNRNQGASERHREKGSLTLSGAAAVAAGVEDGDPAPATPIQDAEDPPVQDKVEAEEVQDGEDEVQEQIDSTTSNSRGQMITQEQKENHKLVLAGALALAVFWFLK